MPDAVASLYGKGHANATRVRECVAMPGKREQTILTPGTILDPLRDVWGTIALDPCAADQAWVQCHRCKGAGVLPRDDDNPEPGDDECIYCDGDGGHWHRDQVCAQRRIQLPDDGTVAPWLDRTFINPPYGTLKDWLRFENVFGRVAWLVPVRTHRKWWRAWAKNLDAIIWLDPLKFVGHRQTFPAPLCLGYAGPDAEKIVEKFAHLGAPL